MNEKIAAIIKNIMHEMTEKGAKDKDTLLYGIAVQSYRLGVQDGKKK